MINVIDYEKGDQPDDDQLKQDMAFWVRTWIGEDIIYPYPSENVLLGLPVSAVSPVKFRPINKFEISEANIEWLSRLNIGIREDHNGSLEDENGYTPTLHYVATKLIPEMDLSTIDMSHPKSWQVLADLMKVPYRIKFVNGGYAMTIALDALVYPNTKINF